MTRNEFDSVMVDLKNAYGASKYPDVRLDAFFKKLENIEFDEFKEGILSIIAKDDRAPMLESLQEKFKDSLKKNWQKYTEELKKDVECRLCRNEGFVQYNNEPYVTSVSRCKCVLGKMWPAYPMFNESRIKDIL
jgi:hypothetical protein